MRLHRSLGTVSIALVIAAAAAAWPGYSALRQAKEAADYSCLASLHAGLERQGLLDGNAAQTTWREWTNTEVASVLSGVPPGDCADKSWWNDDVGIRTRRLADGSFESFLWRRSQPAVFSTGMKLPSNHESQRTRPAQATKPRR